MAGDVGLLEAALARLMELLGPGWTMAREVQRGGRRVDAVLAAPAAPGACPQPRIIIEARPELTPGRVHDSVAAQLELARRAWPGDPAAVVVSDWVSPRTRRALDELGIGYLDLTGNASLRLAEPIVVIHTEGAARDPRPTPRHRRGLSGARAGLLVRELVDHHPPRRGGELAAATGLSESYVSRLLDSMTDQGLIGRRARVVIDIDWPALLRTRAQQATALLTANRVVAALARAGLDATLRALREDRARHPVLATGSFAASGFARASVGGGLMLYVPTEPAALEELTHDLALLRVDRLVDAEVLLLQPDTPAPWRRPQPRRVDGVPVVGLSQLVLDCLSGPGRLPADGEAVLGWMSEHAADWRAASPLSVAPSRT